MDYKNMAERNEKNLEEGLLANVHLDQKQNENSAGHDTPQAEKSILSVKWQVLALIISMQSGAFIMMSVVPYLAFMCIHLVPGLNEQNAGSYAGAIVSVSVLGKACSAYAWGVVADKYGRKAVFFYSFLFSIIFSIMFGMSTSITMAFITRFLLGASTSGGMMIKTVCSELACGDKQFEVKLMGFIMGSRGWINLYGPLLSGFLAEPVKQFPNSWISTTFHGFLTKYPFFLPNFAAALYCFIAMIMVYFFIPETSTAEMRNRGGSQVTYKSIIKKPKARDHLVAFWLFSFSVIFFSEAVPLFLVATDGGLSLQENLIGIIYTVSGVIYVLFQYITYKGIQNRFGVYGTLQISSLFSTPILIILPVSIFLNLGQAPNTLSIPGFIFVVSVLGFERIAASTFMATATVAANRSVERHEMAILNALTMTGMGVMNTFSPILAGLLTSSTLTSNLFPPNVGIFITFGVISAMGICIAFLVKIRLKPHYE